MGVAAAGWGGGIGAIIQIRCRSFMASEPLCLFAGGYCAEPLTLTLSPEFHLCYARPGTARGDPARWAGHGRGARIILRAARRYGLGRT